MGKAYEQNLLRVLYWFILMLLRCLLAIIRTFAIRQHELEAI